MQIKGQFYSGDSGESGRLQTNFNRQNLTTTHTMSGLELTHQVESDRVQIAGNNGRPVGYGPNPIKASMEDRTTLRVDSSKAAAYVAFSLAGPLLGATGQPLKDEVFQSLTFYPGQDGQGNPTVTKIVAERDNGVEVYTLQESNGRSGSEFTYTSNSDRRQEWTAQNPDPDLGPL